AEAIRAAIALAAEGDCVLVAGKGHEDYQVVGAEKRPFSDLAEVQAALGVTTA
ncbi:MAG: UDP-N-acetylmuramoyl-L-alanyl-D-glutamate--2,6-diaminopimelate ligase, partial [Chromatocurvus sp.]